MWVAYFVLSRIWFLIYYAEKTNELDWKTILQIPLQGLKLDLSFAAYLSIIPFLFFSFSIWISQKYTRKIIKVFTILMIFFINLLMLIDLELYGSWGMRLDSTPLMYLNTPLEMIASISTAALFLSIFVWLVSSLIYAYLFSKVIDRMIGNLEKGAVWKFPILLFFTGFLILVIRGGLQTIPINQSNVYFSDKMFANHAAVNFAWNFSHSLTHQSFDMVNPFVAMEAIEAQKIVNETRISLINTPNENTNYQLLKTTKPNVILIIWESLTAKVVAPLGGEPNVTENFNRLRKEGILFDNFYSNGDRSDKGMVAILSGYPSQPHTSIIKIPNKTRNLPMLSQKMIDLGYATSFSYGGDLNFGNMNTYFRQGGISNFVDGDQFNDEDWNSKWGVHDHILMKRFLADRIKETQPFFSIVFTLSSHEPFEFPEKYKFGKDTEANKFRSAIAYTDKTIGNFIDQAKKQAWWDNTLIIILADHGHPLPQHEAGFNSPKRFHIPMLWLGGALAQQNTTISNFGSQSDFAYSLLSLLGADPSDFKWGNNILKPSSNHFAHYVFNKGFGIINKNGAVVYDYVAKKNIITEGNPDKNLELLGKAMTQLTYQDFLNKN